MMAVTVPGGDVFLTRRGWRASELVVAIALVTLSLTGKVATGGEDDSITQDYRLKANFLALAPEFVDWPADAAEQASQTFQICVYGAFPFGTDLAERTRKTTVRGRRVEVKWIHQEAALRACQIVFVSQSETQEYKKLMELLRGTSALTVGETPDFIEAGGIVGLEAHASGMQIDVNLDAADRAHLRISSKLLALARRVIGRGSGAKS